MEVPGSLQIIEDKARQNAFEQWRTTMLPGPVGEDLRMPAQFEAAARFIRPEDLDQAVRISADPAQHAQWLREYFDLGFERLYVHNVGLNQTEFIEVFGSRVLPELR